MIKYDIIIIGGGYADIMAALRLSSKLRKNGLSIALINPRPNFVERIRLHKNLAVNHTKGPRSFNIKEMFVPRDIDFIEGEVMEIDCAARYV